ncbi:MAG: S41 family peptidase [Woeseiaceae bacterium]|nr:S41 family peptidase [Woeseiaceae bacterium]
MSLKVRAILVLVIGTVMGLSLSLGGSLVASRQQAAPEARSTEYARLFAEVMERVKQDYVEQVDDKVLLESAIRGMVSDLDTHSEYLNEAEYEDIRVSTSGSYTGVGLEVGTEDDAVSVIAPIDGSPAARAGVKAGDTIIAIDDEPVDATNLRDAIKLLRGRTGTIVSLTVLREPGEQVLIFDLRRASVQVASVSGDVLDPRIGYVRISQFTDSTASEVASAIDAIVDGLAATGDGGLEGLVLDLRNNPGGILDAAVDVSDLFLDSGVIVSADGRTAEARFSKEAHRGDILDGTVMVVLVNRGSASAAEIVAGALQDHGRALIVGTGTFGKGLVQTVMPLSRGRAIKLTTSRYYTPSGDSIHKTGIAPDVFIEDDGTHPGYSLAGGVDREGDAQLAEAIERLRQKRVMHSRVDRS